MVIVAPGEVSSLGVAKAGAFRGGRQIVELVNEDPGRAAGVLDHREAFSVRRDRQFLNGRQFAVKGGCDGVLSIGGRHYGGSCNRQRQIKGQLHAIPLNV